jgi:hypothetical protein
MGQAPALVADRLSLISTEFPLIVLAMLIAAISGWHSNSIPN